MTGSAAIESSLLGESFEHFVTRVADFSAGHDAANRSGPWAGFDRDWRALWFGQGVEPPTGVLADEVLAAGATGIVLASTLAAGGRNVVLCIDTLAAGDTLAVNDPGAVLPGNQDSWR